MSREAIISEVTKLLIEWGQGKDQALLEVLPMVYDELHSRAHRLFRQEQGDHLLQTTALINEAYLRFAKGERIQVESRAHFLALVTRMMQRILVEEARKRLAAKRGGELWISLDERRDEGLPGRVDAETLLALDQALDCLRDRRPRAARVLELKFYGDLENQEIAKVLNTSPATVKREWTLAKQHLFLIMSGHRSGFEKTF